MLMESHYAMHACTAYSLAYQHTLPLLLFHQYTSILFFLVADVILSPLSILKCYEFGTMSFKVVLLEALIKFTN